MSIYIAWVLLGAATAKAFEKIEVFREEVKYKNECYFVVLNRFWSNCHCPNNIII